MLPSSRHLEYKISMAANTVGWRSKSRDVKDTAHFKTEVNIINFKAKKYLAVVQKS